MVDVELVLGLTFFVAESDSFLLLLLKLLLVLFLLFLLFLLLLFLLLRLQAVVVVDLGLVVIESRIAEALGGSGVNEAGGCAERSEAHF